LAKFISENQKDWDRWIPFYLLAYRSKHKTIGMIPEEVYFAQDLCLPTDLLCGNPPKTGGWFFGRLHEKKGQES